MVLKWKPLGSLREEFWIPGRKFVPGRNWGGKAAKINPSFLFILVYSTHKKTAQRGCFIPECLQYASTTCFSSSFEPIRSVHCLAALDIRAANRLPHHPKPPGGAIHGEIDGLDIGRQYGKRFGLLRHTYKPQKRPCSIHANRSRNVQHLCGGDWVEPTLSVAHTGILVSSSGCYFRLFLNNGTVCHGLRSHSGCDTAGSSWQGHSSRVFRGWKCGIS